MGGGSILAGLMLGAIGVFVIERDFVKASAFALAGAVLTYFGFMHGEAVGIGGGFGVTPAVALAYAVVAAGLFALSRVGAGEHYVAHPDMPWQRRRSRAYRGPFGWAASACGPKAQNLAKAIDDGFDRHEKGLRPARIFLKFESFPEQGGAVIDGVD